MKIPQYIRQEPARVIPGVRVNPAAMTQDLQAMGQFGEAMGQFGETLSRVGNEFGTKMREAREVSEYSNAENSWKEGINKFKLGLETDTDYKTFSARFEKTQGDLYNQVASGITEPNAKATFKRFVDKNLVSERFEIGRKANKLEIGFMEADYYKQIELAIKRGDIDFINKSTNAAISAGYLKADVGEKARENAIAKTNYNTAWNNIITAPSRDDAVRVVKDSALLPSEKNALISRYDQEVAFKKAQAKEQKEADIAKVQDDFVTRAYDPKNPLTHSEVDSAILEPVGGGSKAFFHELINKRVKAVIDETNLPYTTDNGKAIADILLRNTDPDQKPLTPTQILEEVPKRDSYSLQTAQNLIKAMDVTSTDIFKNTDASLKAMFGYEGILKGFGTKPLAAVYYNNAMVEILTDQAKSPLKGAELRNRIYELAEPYLREHWTSSGDTEGNIDMRLKAMGIKQSPSAKVVPPPAQQVQTPSAPGIVLKRKVGETYPEWEKRHGLHLK